VAVTQAEADGRPDSGCGLRVVVKNATPKARHPAADAPTRRKPCPAAPAD